MSEESFYSLGKIEAIKKLYEGTPYHPFDSCWYENTGKGYSTTKTKLLLEGINFDLIYFPLKHLGYKSVIEATGELYAEMSQPRTLDIVLGVSSKLDFEQIKEIWSGIVSAATEHGYSKVGLDLVPSRNGLCISVCAMGETTLLQAKRRPAAKSMDLICISGNLGASFLGLNILEKEKARFAKEGENASQPKLDEYRHLIGAYLKPELPANILKELEEAEIYPSFGYMVSKGLGDTLRRLTRDSGLGTKVYVDRLPFAGNTFDVSKQLGIDAMTAALDGGDDNRLLFTIPLSKHDRFRHDFQTFDIIGHLARPEVGAVLVTPDGAELPVHARGWDRQE